MKLINDVTNLKGMTLKDRVVFSSVGHYSPDGNPTAIMWDKYRALSENEVSVILTGITNIDPNEDYSGLTRLSNDSYIEENRKLVDMIHQNGSLAVIQLASLGSNTFNVPEDYSVLGPSAVPNHLTNITPQEMTIDEIEAIVPHFADATERAMKAGYDGVQIHAGHHFMLAQFLSPHYNKRNDVYGGSVEKRAKLTIDVLKAIRERVGDDYPIWIKIDSNDGFEDGLKEGEFEEIIGLLSKYGVNAIEVSGDLGAPKRKTSFFLEEAKSITKYNVPVILTGGVRDFKEMETILKETDIDYFGLCKPLISEPDLMKRYHQADMNDISMRCVSCGGCFAPDSYMNCVLK